MGRAVVTTVQETPVGDFPALAGVEGRGLIESRAVIGGPERPLLLWSHRLAPGAEIEWDRPPVGHAVYLWQGEARMDGRALETTGAGIVGHGGRAVLAAGAEGCELLHFQERDDGPPPTRRGGCVHVVNPGEALRYEPGEGIVYADSGCPYCELWLHSNRMPAVEGGVPRHMHSEDEVIVVTEGAMAFGTRDLPPGTALAIDAETVYAFKAGPDGLKFVNFRAKDPYYIAMNKKGRGEPISERGALAALTGDEEAKAALLAKANIG